MRDDQLARGVRYRRMAEQLNQLAGIDASAQVEPELEDLGHRPFILRLHAADMLQLLDRLAAAEERGGESALAELFAT